LSAKDVIEAYKHGWVDGVFAERKRLHDFMFNRAHEKPDEPMNVWADCFEQTLVGRIEFPEPENPNKIRHEEEIGNFIRTGGKGKSEK